MSYINNGYQRFCSLTITESINGVVVSTNVLPFTSAFTQNGFSYPALNVTDPQELAKLDIASYEERATAYAAYVVANYQSQYPGLTVDPTGARVYNTTACPI
jgi:hypothetical protein